MGWGTNHLEKKQVEKSDKTFINDFFYVNVHPLIFQEMDSKSGDKHFFSDAWKVLKPPN